MKIFINIIYILCQIVLLICAVFTSYACYCKMESIKYVDCASEMIFISPLCFAGMFILYIFHDEYNVIDS